MGAEVIGVEPDPTLLGVARERPGRARVLHGSAEHIPLPDGSVDVVHARFAYFFPYRDFDPTPGLVEVGRVLKPDGKLVVIDNDTEDGEFAELLKASPWAATQGQDTYARDWWKSKEADTTPVLSSWEFDSRADLEAVLLGVQPRGCYIVPPTGQVAKSALAVDTEPPGLTQNTCPWPWQSPHWWPGEVPGGGQVEVPTLCSCRP